MKTVRARMHADRPVTEERLEDAIERGGVRQRSSLRATSLSYVAPCLQIGFEDGSGVLLPVSLYSEFDGFQAEDFADLKLGFAGTALCHDAQDLQVSIAGMISLSPPLMTMAAAVIASRNARQSSAARTEAARANGRRGWRPCKSDSVV
ncbi:hypothetical protein [Pseudomonas sp. efr-133-TYG-5]|uniref:hypothetical protein n=1 Tax=Pseudomonas sp. efr-133-TYG-5 TaxID=3040310 RepID=UPI002557AE97|nr:hypothetical protein [Pseudomonas sp. efr-133-TYG-5]